MNQPFSARVKSKVGENILKLVDTCFAFPYPFRNGFIYTAKNIYLKQKQIIWRWMSSQEIPQAINLKIECSLSSQNFLSLALTVWDLWCFNDVEEKYYWMVMSNKAACRTARATPGLLNTLLEINYVLSSRGYL